MAVVGEAGPEAIVPLSGTQGRDYSMGLSGQGKGRDDIAVYVNVTGGADPEVTGQVIGREVRRELTRLFERTALEG
jgi:phage-related minor tail protein